jgi:hypothetical protein
VHTQGFDTNVEIIRHIKEGYASVVKLDTQEEIGRVPFTDGLPAFFSYDYIQWKANPIKPFWEKRVSSGLNNMRLHDESAEQAIFEVEMSRQMMEADNAQKLFEAEHAKRLIESEVKNVNVRNSLPSVMDEFDGGFNIPLINRLLDIFDSSYFFAFMNFFLFSIILFCLVAFVKYILYTVKKRFY